MKHYKTKCIIATFDTVKQLKYLSRKLKANHSSVIRTAVESLYNDITDKAICNVQIK